MLRALALLAALSPAAAAQIGVVLAVEAPGERVFLGAADLDGDGSPEIVSGVPAGRLLSRLIVRDGRTGVVAWTSDDLGGDPRFAVGGWSGSVRRRETQYRSEGDDVEYPVLPARWGDAPFADVDGDGDREVVVFETSAGRLLVIGD